MKIFYHKTPFEHVVIKNFFSSNELEEINSELDSICGIKNITNIIKHGTAALNGRYLAQRTAFFIDHIFKNNLDKSKIYKYATKPIKPPLSIEISENSSFGTCLKSINNSCLLLSMYRDTDSYLPHTDTSLLTGISYITKNQNNITGGELYFPDFMDFKILPEYNTFVLFPSYIKHGVHPVNVIDKNKEDTVRISLSMFTYVLPLPK